MPVSPSAHTAGRLLIEKCGEAGEMTQTIYNDAASVSIFQDYKVLSFQKCSFVSEV